MPSVIEAFEVDAGISGRSVKTSGQCDSSLLEKSALLSFLIVPLLKSVEEWWWYCNQLVVEDFPHVYVMNHGDCQKPPKTIHQCQVSASNPFICEIFHHIPYVDTLHFLRGSQKCFAGVSHNRSLIKSMKITLLLSGMQLVEFSTSVDAFWSVVIFIRWSEHYSNRTNHGVHTFFNVLHIPLVLVGTGITYLFSSISPRVTQFFESLSVFSWKEGERRWYIQLVHYIIAMTTDKSATMLPPTADTFNQILRAKFHIFIWCKSHIPNQELIEPVVHS